MTIDTLLQQLQQNPEKTQFSEVIATIEAFYDYTPTRFYNGLGEDRLCNEAGQNEGSCKIFAFAKLHQLGPEQTLHCFGDYYRKDVLEHPQASDHGNIRNFIQYGWEGIQFDSEALSLR